MFCRKFPFKTFSNKINFIFVYYDIFYRYFFLSQSLKKLCNLILEEAGRQFYELYIFPRYLAKRFIRRFEEDFASRHDARKVFIGAII